MGDIVTIRETNLQIRGTIETDAEGNQIARDFYHRIVGKYRAKQNVTTDFYGRIVARGNIVASLIPPYDQQH